MEKKAMITIRGTQKARNEPPQVMEFVTAGKLQRFGSKLRVSYEESELIGMEGVTTAFEVDGGRVTLERTGKLHAKMEFIEGERTESLYSMDIGAMLLGVVARKVEAHLTDEGGSIYLEYGVELERSFLGLNTYDIEVKTVEEPPEGGPSETKK